MSNEYFLEEINSSSKSNSILNCEFIDSNPPVLQKLFKIIQIQQLVDELLLNYPEPDLSLQTLASLTPEFSVSVASATPPSLKKIAKDIKSYIYCNCNHIWIEDYIDVDLDNSIKITYCDICSLSPL